MVKGAVPLTHSGCTVIKVHGDYRDVRLRNTSEELANYDSDLNKLLDQTFDEYGLIDRVDVGPRTGSHRGHGGCRYVAHGVTVSARMIAPPANTQIWIAAGVTDMRRGFSRLSGLV